MQYLNSDVEGKSDELTEKLNTFSYQNATKQTLAIPSPTFSLQRQRSRKFGCGNEIFFLPLDSYRISGCGSKMLRHVSYVYFPIPRRIFLFWANFSGRGKFCHPRLSGGVCKFNTPPHPIPSLCKQKSELCFLLDLCSFQNKIDWHHTWRTEWEQLILKYSINVI
jgi:hypothetical protein